MPSIPSESAEFAERTRGASQWSRIFTDMQQACDEIYAAIIAEEAGCQSLNALCDVSIALAAVLVSDFRGVPWVSGALFRCASSVNLLAASLDFFGADPSCQQAFEVVLRALVRNISDEDHVNALINQGFIERHR
eukprot:IDg6698t1